MTNTILDRYVKKKYKYLFASLFLSSKLYFGILFWYSGRNSEADENSDANK